MGRVSTLFIPLSALALLLACSQVKKTEAGKTDAVASTTAAASDPATQIMGPDGKPLMEVTPANGAAPATTATEQKATAKSKIAFVLEEFNWGAVDEGEKVEHRFTFTNTGSELLEIFEAKPGCGCTVTDYSRSVEPGGEGFVMGTVNSANMKGEQTKTITVKTNSAETPEIRLTMKGEVRSILSIEPASITFGQIDVVGGTVVGDMVKLVSVTKGAALTTGFNITEAKLAGNEDWITVTSEKKSDGNYQIKVDLIEAKAWEAAKANPANANAAQSGNQYNFNATLTITTDIAGQTPKTIGINGSFMMK